MENQIIRLRDLTRKVGLSRSTLYRLVRAGKFPPQIPLSERARGWLASDVDAWLQRQTAQSRSGE